MTGGYAMQENMSELSRKYREEMLRLYGGAAQQRTPMKETLPTPEAAARPAASDTSSKELPGSAESSQEPEPVPDLLTPLEEQIQENMEAEQILSEDPSGTVYEEPVLPDYIRPGVPAPEPEYTDYGWLYVAAVTGNGAFPVEDAHITVVQHRGDGQYLVHQMRTDESGETPQIRISTPPASLSQSPGNAQGYALCDIRIYAKGFFRNEALNVPIFADVVSRQVFRMIPLPLTAHEDMEIIQFPSEAPNP